jgi:hypothetical protein
VLPEGNSTQPLTVVQGDTHMPKPIDPMNPSREQKATPGQDPWLDREYEMFSILPFDYATNQCVLTSVWEEGSNVTTDPSNNFRDDVNYDQNCTGFCRFPGDHTEVGGVRRIHYENSIGNLVMRVPRDPLHPSNPPLCSTNPPPGTPCDMTPPAKPDPPRWAVPPEGYMISFLVYGGLTPYTKVAQTSQRDVSSGVLAQSLKAAVSGLDGILYLIDEGRNGTPTGLGGQVMRAIGAIVDPYFLLR